ncbi:MAG: Crp/Fnr family transcriptional regulator [Desulfosarcina sp.]|nr:Crp/Fnr family transcriptional regulator [Desulfobacterales bacterium]
MIVKEIELFKGIDGDVINEIAGICSEETYSKDTLLCEKGQKANFMYILEEGTVNQVIKNGGTIVYQHSDPGLVLGWSAMIESGVYTASAVCATDIKVLKIEKGRLNIIFDHHPKAGLIILRRLGRVVAQRLGNAYRDLLSAGKEKTEPSYG